MAPQENQGQYLTLNEVADHIGPTTKRTVLNEVVRGNLPATRIGKKWLVRRDDLTAYLAPAAQSSTSCRAVSCLPGSHVRGAE